ncbi:MAG: hypothetical protein AABY43_00265 [Candidatus Omnitrophota bacterium]
MYQFEKTKQSLHRRFVQIRKDFYIEQKDSKELNGGISLNFESLPLSLNFELIIVDYNETAYGLIFETQPRELGKNKVKKIQKNNKIIKK